MLHVRCARALALSLGLALAVGCGKSEPKRYAVSGTVKYKDKLIGVGSITFIPEGGDAQMGGAPIKDGKYELPAVAGLRAGTYKVSISYPDPKGTPAAGDAPGASLDAKNLMPAKYNEQTELRAEVTADKSNVFDYDLK